MIALVIRDEAAMLALGAELARLLQGQGAVLVRGDLGAGKTTLCRGLLHAMGHSGSVKSPTFTLVEPYEINDRAVYHFDLYRLAHADELEYIGIDEYFGDNSLCLVEWPEKADGQLPPHDLEIAIDVSGEKRNISIQAISTHGESVCKALAEISGQT